MLEYREFPLKTIFIYALLAIPLAFSIFVITGLMSGSILNMTLLEHQGLIGIGALAATIALPLSGMLIDRIRRHDLTMYLGAVVPSIVVMLGASSLVPVNMEILSIDVSTVIQRVI